MMSSLHYQETEKYDFPNVQFSSGFGEKSMIFRMSNFHLGLERILFV